MAIKFKRIKYGCYTSNVCMSIVSALSPLLFISFKDLYNISYTLLGALVLINFTTQLLVDLVFSFFSNKFNIELCVKGTPIICVVGMALYALAPILFQNNIYIGLVIGTIIFSAASGLGEVLISRVIAAIPANNPEREMSKLHSIYAWGVVIVVVFSTLFLHFAGQKYWQILVAILTVVPITAIALYIKAPFPTLVEDEEGGNFKSLLCFEFFLSVVCIFLGAASENVMSQWISGYSEKALLIPKLWGDLFGVAMFSVMLGLGRSLYAKFGKNITVVLISCSILAFICYIVAALSSNVIIALIACALAGLATSMLWPGNLIAATKNFSGAGVAMFAMMAAGGDLGGSVAPQLMGAITDTFMKNSTILEYATINNLTIDAVAMKVALLCISIFPLLSIVSSITLHFVQKKQAKVAYNKNSSTLN